MSAAAAIADAAVERRVLVVGSPPPGGRDLDLLVRPDEEVAIASALADDGYVGRGSTWARFGGGSADVVDLIPAAEWGHGDELFEEAVPLDGFSRLVVPAAHHDLLLAATRFLTPGGQLKPGRLARLSRDEAAWRRARAQAPAWNGEAGLERLRALVFEGAPRRDRGASLRALARRRPVGTVVALSGIDGSGRTAQAEALVEALDRLGYDAAIERAPLAGGALARPVERLRRRVPAPAVPVRHAGPGLRGRSRVVGEGRATLAALGDGVRHARRSARHLAAGRVVVFDRYELDAVVRLRLRYGERRRFSVQRRIIRLLSPGPAVAFHLDVDAARSLAREDDDRSAAELALQIRLYREERDAFGARALAGTRPAGELSAEIAQLVWRALPQRY